MATEWLCEKWGEQRPVRNGYVKKLASDMESGRFNLGPDAIVRIRGKLANGQHRLNAVVKSGKAQTFIVMESNDDEMYKIIDSGMRRIASDSLLGVKYARCMPSVARWIMGYESNSMFSAASSAADVSRIKSGKDIYARSQVEIINYCKNNEETLSEAIEFVYGLVEKTRILTASIAAAIYIIGSSSKIGKEKTKDFLTAVFMDGGQNAAGDLRNKLICNANSKRRLMQGYIFAVTLKSLRSFANGTRLGVLKFANGESFPEL